MNRLSTTEARNQFADAINRVSYGGERIVLDRNGKDVAALVSIDDLRLLELLEDRMDIEAARKALAEEETVSLADLKKELGL